jgi:hypothetical protein
MERYAVFGMFVDGSATFLGTTDDFTAAKKVMLNAARRTALEHFVYDFKIGDNVATSLEQAGPAGKVGGTWAT